MPPAGTKKISIEGQFASGVLGTFRIIRGFATLQDLAAISAPYEMVRPGLELGIGGYQRNIDPQHATDIKRYLELGKLRFLPEIILSIRATYEDLVTVKGLERRVTGTVSDAGDGLFIKPRRKTDSLHVISVEADQLDEFKAQRRIRRIDGNHRLHLAAELAVDPLVDTKYLAPFCAVLLGPPGDANDDYVEAMLFHTINSTAMQLDSEHALELVLGQAAEFRPSAEEEFSTNPPLHLTRALMERIGRMPQAQRDRLGSTPATVLNAAATAMVLQKPELGNELQTLTTFAEELSGTITDLLTRLAPACPELCKADFFIELASLAWAETDPAAAADVRTQQAVGTLEAMGRWLGRDGFHGIQSKRSMAQQLFEIYRAVRLRIPRRVFLSRWYPSDADGAEKTKADNRKQMIDRTLNDLRAEGIHLALDDPGTEAGGTFGIHKEMYDALSRDDIILVDLSGVRPNVCIEAGYALKHLDRGRLIFLFQPTAAGQNNPAWEAPPFDLSTFRYEMIADTGEIPDKLKPHLRTIWQEAQAGQ